MDILRKYFSDSKKAKMNIATAFIIGVFLIIISNSYMKITNDNKGTETIYNSLETSESVTTNYESELEEELENILSMVAGAGKVECMITFENTKEVVFAKDLAEEYATVIERDSESGERSTVNKSKDEKLVFGNSNEPVVVKEITPKACGVIIVAQGGDNPLIKKAFVDVATSLLGVEVHKVQILKMN